MNKKYENALPLLAEKVAFQMQIISALDLYYNDGDARVKASFFKLIFPKAVVYIYEGGWWVSYGSLTDAESLAIHDWIDDLCASRE
jgi:hypothetical protein